jgi:hypothetical protein
MEVPGSILKAWGGGGTGGRKVESNLLARTDNVPPLRSCSWSMAGLDRGHHCTGSFACGSGRTRDKATGSASSPIWKCGQSENDGFIGVEGVRKGPRVGGSYCHCNALPLRC